MTLKEDVNNKGNSEGARGDVVYRKSLYFVQFLNLICSKKWCLIIIIIIIKRLYLTLSMQQKQWVKVRVSNWYTCIAMSNVDHHDLLEDNFIIPWTLV